MLKKQVLSNTAEWFDLFKTTTQRVTQFLNSEELLRKKILLPLQLTKSFAESDATDHM